MAANIHKGVTAELPEPAKACALPPTKPPRKIADDGPGAAADAKKNPKTAAEEAEEDAAKDAKARSALPRYYYTQKEFWGGTTLSYTMYKILALFPISGFLGLDHMYMRSPGTGFMKFLMNILTLGYWYFYDAFQTFKDEEDVMKFGVSMPLYGPSGIAAGSFGTEDEPATDGNGSATSFLLFCIGTFFLPFGVEYIFAGDMTGFACKFVGTLFFFGLIYGLFNIIKLVSHPERMMCEGVSRFAPFTWWPIEVDEMFTETSFKNKLVENCPPAEGAVGGWFSGLLGNLITKVPVLRELYAMVETGKAVAGETVKKTKAAIAKGADVVAGVAAAGQQIAELKTKAAGMAGGGGVEPPAIRAAPWGGTNTILTFTFALVFIGAAVLKGKDAVTALMTKREERPGALGNYVIRNKNASLFPALPPESGVF
jgi:hypothetical protein